MPATRWGSKIHIISAAQQCAACPIFLPTIFLPSSRSCVAERQGRKIEGNDVARGCLSHLPSRRPLSLFFCEQLFQFGQPGWRTNFIETFRDLVTSELPALDEVLHDVREVEGPLGRPTGEGRRPEEAQAIIDMPHLRLALFLVVD